MNWITELAKNNQYTLKLNGKYLYSKYNPQEDVARFMNKEIDLTKKKFIIAGLGLGYHHEYVLNQIEGAEVQYIILSDKEKGLFLENASEELKKNKRLYQFNNDDTFIAEAQVIVPRSFLNAIGREHPLYNVLEDIKIRQVSFERYGSQMEANFYENLSFFKPLVRRTGLKKKAALVSSGPSINETIHWLNENKDEFDVYCVGSSLKILLKENIIPNAVFMSDAQDSMLQQVPEDFQGELIFLSTANYKAIKKHSGLKQIIFQKGYDIAENFALKEKQPLFETGGSVATVAFSFINYMQYEELYLFGQDLGYFGENTHAKDSTSGRVVVSSINQIEIEANDGTIIHTTPNLLAYKRWFDQAFLETTMTIINTARKGAKIENTTFLNID